VTVGVDESDVPQPFELQTQVEQLVRRIFFSGGDVERAKELFMERACGRGHMFEIQERAARGQQLVDLFIERAFPIVRQVVNRKARHDGVEGAQ
jgi:hypothetical protein